MDSLLLPALWDGDPCPGVWQDTAGSGSSSLLLSLSAALAGEGELRFDPRVPPRWARGLAGLFWLSRNCKAGTLWRHHAQKWFQLLSSENTAEPPPQWAGCGGVCWDLPAPPSPAPALLQHIPALLQHLPAPLWLCLLGTSGSTQDPRAKPQWVMVAASFSF